MLHAKFQDHRTSGSGKEDFFKVFAIYGHGGHLGQLFLTSLCICVNEIGAVRATDM